MFFKILTMKLKTLFCDIACAKEIKFLIRFGRELEKIGHSETKLLNM